MYYEDQTTDVPFCQLFEAIEKLQNIEELDDLTDKLRQRLHKLFVKLPVKELPDGSFGRKYSTKYGSVIYYPNGLTTMNGCLNIFLKGYDEPDYPKTAEPAKEEPVELKKARRKSSPRSRVLFYTNVGGVLQRQILSYEDRKITNLLEYLDLPLYKMVAQFGKLASLSEGDRNAFWENSKSIEQKVEYSIRRTRIALLGYSYWSNIQDRSKPAIFYRPEAFDIIRKLYIKIGKKDANFSYEDRQVLKATIKQIEADPSLIIKTDLMLTDFMVENLNRNGVFSYIHDDFQAFMTRAYPKILKLAEEHELLRIYFEKAEILPPPSKEVVAERKKKRAELEAKQEAKQEAELAAAEAAGSTILEAQVLDIA